MAILQDLESKISHAEQGKCFNCQKPLDSALDDLRQYKKEHQLKTQELSAMQSSLETQTRTLNEITPALEKFDWTEKDKIQNEINKTNESISIATQELSEHHNARETYRVALAEYNSVCDTVKSMIDSYEEQGKKIYNTLIGYKKSIEEAKKEEYTLNYLEKMFGRQGIQTSVIRDIEKPLNDKLEDLMRRFGFKVSKIELSTVTQLANGDYRDKISVALKEGRTKRSFKSYSQGEKRRLDLVFFLALRSMLEVKVSTNLLVLDEVVNNLDSSGVKGLKEYIDSTMQDTCTLIAIPTESFEWSCQHKWTAVKSGGVSCLEQ